MEKVVVLTEDQAVAIKKWKEEGWPIDLFVISGSSYSNTYKSLNTLSIQEFANALYSGFEVKRSKKRVGDKVIRLDGDHNNYKRYVLEVVEVGEKIKVSDGKGWSASWPCEELRHANPEEIYWLEMLGRENVRDFKEGDVIVRKDGTHTIIEKEYTHRFNDKGISESMKGLYPAESFKRYPQEDK